MRRTSKAGAERGYAIAAILIVMVVMAMGAQVTAIPVKSALVRNDEAELIFRGQAYVAAIISYRTAIKGDDSLPQKLTDLEDDRRGGLRRHIRRLYTDPMTGGAWTVLKDDEGGIYGVASKAAGAPRKKTFFPPGLARFKNAKTYADWKFIDREKAPPGD